jgi:hypothetical protein
MKKLISAGESSPLSRFLIMISTIRMVASPNTSLDYNPAKVNHRSDFDE